MSLSQKPLQTKFFFGLLLLVGVCGILVLRPYLITLAVAATFAVVLEPVHAALLRMWKGRKGAAAASTVLVTGLLVLAPLSLVISKIAQEAANLYRTLSEGEATFPDRVLTPVVTFIRQYIPQFDVEIGAYAGQIFSWLAGNVGPVFAGTFGTIIHLLLGIIAFFYLVRDGHVFMESLVGLSPLSDENDRKIQVRLQAAINSIIKGNLTIALLQGISSGIGMAIFGVPSATLWGSLAAVAALVPSVGTAVVLTPAVLYLFAVGNTFAGIGLIIWGATAVGLIDNILGPILVGRGAKIHPLWILFAVIGGLELIGPAGFLIGPLIISLLYALLDIYRDLFITQKGKGTL